MNRIYALLDKRLRPLIPPRIKAHYRPVSPATHDLLLEAESEFSGKPIDALSSIDDLLYGRLREFRSTIIPWIETVFNLEGRGVLEIGAGTGASTVALAEQGARVEALDVQSESVNYARKRLLAYGLTAEVVVRNGAEIEYADGSFDVVMFWASLEHMTYRERQESLFRSWRALKPDGYLVVVEVPNRLWYFDNHTSCLPFFHWLPDELATQYARQSPRQRFVKAMGASPSELARSGRGVSYHEFELSIGIEACQRVCSSLGEYLGRNPIRRAFRACTSEYRYMRLLGLQDMPRHVGWREQTLNIVIRK